MALPPFRDDGWLPEGHHSTTWEDIIAVFGGDVESQRSRVLNNLLIWRNAVQQVGLSGLLILDGSFISQKIAPGDFDAIFICDEICESILLEDSLAKELTDYQRCKEKGWGDIVTFGESTVRRFPLFCRLDGFDLDKKGVPKGVLEVRL